MYGTLRSSDLMAAVAGDGPLDAQDANLDGYAVRPVSGQPVPCIVRSRARAEGVLWSRLTPTQMKRLDLYERAFGYRLAPVCVVLAGVSRQAHCYVPPSDVHAGPGTWDLAAWEAEHLAPALLAVDELFSQDPLPTPAALRQMWPMIEARAWSKHRADAAAAQVRSRPQGNAFSLTKSGRSAGAFFRFQRFDVTHDRFDGQRSPVLSQEAFIGVDAAIVLPYDPVRDRVLLVEQFRLGPAVRQDPNPWVLEAVAGIVDAHETPEQAAIREAREEAGVEIAHLEHAGGSYPSPGATTDYFHHFVGLCDLPATASFQGGLDAEHEDLKLHPMSFDTALALIETGEANVGPLCFLLYWLAAHRDRLRKMA